MSRPVLTAPSIDRMKAMPNTHRLPVRVPGKRGGTFDPTNEDPFGAGEDGGIVFSGPASGPAWYVRRFGGPVNVRWFGDIGNGEDATSAFNAAIATAKTLSGNDQSPQEAVGINLYVPEGEYLISEQIDISTTGVTIFGDGPFSTIIKAEANSSFTGTYVFSFERSDGNDMYYASVRDLMIRGDGTTGSNFPRGMQLLNCNRWVLDNVRLHYLDRAWIGNRCFTGRAYSVQTYHCDRAARIVNVGQDFQAFGCGFKQGEGGSSFQGLEIEETAGAGIYGCTFEGNKGIPLAINGRGAGIKISSCFFEVNESNEIFLAQGSGKTLEGVVITGNKFSTKTSGVNVVELRNEDASNAIGGVLVAGNWIRSDEGSGTVKYDYIIGTNNAGGGGFNTSTIRAIANGAGDIPIYEGNDADVAAVNRSAKDIGSYTASNVTSDRTIDADSTTLDEIADVLGTLIGDLQDADILG